VERTNDQRREEEKGSWEDILVNPATRSQQPIVWRGEDEDRERERERKLKADREVLSGVSDNDNGTRTRKHQSKRVNSLATKSGPSTFPFW